MGNNSATLAWFLPAPRSDAYQNLNITPHLVSLFTFRAFITPCDEPVKFSHEKTFVSCMREGLSYIIGEALKKYPFEHIWSEEVPGLCAFAQMAQIHRMLQGWVSCPVGFSAHRVVYTRPQRYMRAPISHQVSACDHMSARHEGHWCSATLVGGSGNHRTQRGAAWQCIQVKYIASLSVCRH